MLRTEISGGTCTASTSVAASAAVTAASSPSPQSQPQTQTQTQVVASPCAACKILRRRCVADKCVLAPYFPPTEPTKFTIAHRVFGASNIIKFLQELPESQKTDAVNSMVYEARARIRDPVYGSAGSIYHLQRQVIELRAQIAEAQVEIMNMQHQRSNLLALLVCKTDRPNTASPDQQQGQNNLSNLEPSSFESGDELMSSSPRDDEIDDLGFLEDYNSNNSMDDINTTSSMPWWDHPLWSS
ncbi:PREDICTED: LOB domain-containing protein 1 [Tarenaya hassleriana]|uniref:LOB domain-containing protein 1 n=1 Tax=Tarenaya hassleriana TaxID=28532 RepID=UPI00053C9041|nr:PREDICTED: LOB domain-containing protein 1 [Tarenaya hassleriana]